LVYPCAATSIMARPILTAVVTCLGISRFNSG
jgi:hypothetical protein